MTGTILAKTILVSDRVGETRVALLANGIVLEIHLFRTFSPSRIGHIYRAAVCREAPEFEGIFLTLEGDQAGFMPQRKTGKTKWTEGQAVLVQVVKDAVGDKACEVTTNIELTARTLNWRPLSRGCEISKHIPKGRRTDLKALLNRFSDSPGRLHLRTAAAVASDDQIAADLSRVTALWTGLQADTRNLRKPHCLYAEKHPALHFIRDRPEHELEAVWFDNAGQLAEARKFLNMPTGSGTDILHLYQEGDLFERFGAEATAESLMSPQVNLPGGGWIMIEETEALTAIDVNAGAPGKAMGYDRMCRQTNGEAAAEIARQLRLRQIGGLIVIDFIDMSNRDHIKEVLEILDKHLADDAYPTTRTNFSAFGLVELTRKKTGPSLPCQLGRVTGFQPSPATTALKALRLAEQTSRHHQGRALAIEINPVVTEWLAEPTHTALVADLEKRIGARVDIRPKTTLAPGEINIYTV